MNASIPRISTNTMIRSIDEKPPDTSPVEKSTVATINASNSNLQSSVDLKLFDAFSAETPPSKFGIQEVEQPMLVSELTQQDVEKDQIRQLFRYVDKEHHGQWFWNGREDGLITAHNINKVRESLKNSATNQLGLLSADGHSLTREDVLKMLIYLDNALVKHGKKTEGGEKVLSTDQLEEAFNQETKKGVSLYKIKSS